MRVPSTMPPLEADSSAIGEGARSRRDCGCCGMRKALSSGMRSKVVRRRSMAALSRIPGAIAVAGTTTTLDL